MDSPGLLARAAQGEAGLRPHRAEMQGSAAAPAREQRLRAGEGWGPGLAAGLKLKKITESQSLGLGTSWHDPPKPSRTPHSAALTAREISWREPLRRPSPDLLPLAPHTAFLRTPSPASHHHHHGVSKTRGLGPQEQCKPAPHPDVTPGLSPALLDPGLPTHTPAANVSPGRHQGPRPSSGQLLQGTCKDRGVTGGWDPDEEAG